MAALLLLLLGACSPLRLLGAIGPQDGFTKQADLSYGSHPRQRLDVFMPTAPIRDDLIVLFVYGGSWKSGDREDYGFVGQTLAARGLITVVVDYRLYPEARFPAFVEDIAVAAAWVRRNLPASDGNARRLVLMGHSAGAHSAALVALDRRYLRTVDVDKDAIAGLVGLAGPYAFDPTTLDSTREIFATAPSAAQARPVTFAGADAPPSLLFHGTADNTVRPSNSQALATALKRAGVSVRYRAIGDVGHVGTLLALAPVLQQDAGVIEETVKFVRNLPSEQKRLPRQRQEVSAGERARSAAARRRP